MAGGAGAGIGGHGGSGGKANATNSNRLGLNVRAQGKDASNPGDNTNCGWDGKDGEDCGTIIINGEIKVYAYGGSRWQWRNS